MSRKKGSARPTSSKSNRDVVVPSGIDAASWRQLQDDAGIQDVIADTICQVLCNLNDIILEREINKSVKVSVVEEAVNAARSALEVNYLFKDPGEPDLAVSSWLPDDECIPPPIDSWAPGAMPTITPQQLDRHERNNRAELLASRRGSLASKATSPTLTTPASVGSLPTDLKPFEQASTKPNTPEPRPPRTAKSAGKIAASRRAQSAGDGTGHSKSSSAPRSVSAQEARKPRPLPPAEKPSSRSRRRPASKPEFKGNANPKVPAIRA